MDVPVPYGVKVVESLRLVPRFGGPDRSHLDRRHRNPLVNWKGLGVKRRHIIPITLDGSIVTALRRCDPISQTIHPKRDIELSTVPTPGVKLSYREP